VVVAVWFAVPQTREWDSMSAYRAVWRIGLRSNLIRDLSSDQIIKPQVPIHHMWRAHRLLSPGEILVHLNHKQDLTA